MGGAEGRELLPTDILAAKRRGSGDADWWRWNWLRVKVL